MDNTINGRTPEEIKKGLECCSTTGKCEECAYAERCAIVAEEDPRMWFGEPVMKDALAYIQQLETGIDRIYKHVDALRGLPEKIQQLERERDEARDDLDTLNYANTELHSAYDAMKRERDAAVEDIFPMCSNCKHEKLGYGVGPCPPIEEYVTTDCSNWQWRGVPQEVE